MSPFDRVLAIAQCWILIGWELVGLYFGWDAIAILIVWFAALWTFNIVVATGVRTYYKLTKPELQITQPEITPEDIGG